MNKQLRDEWVKALRSGEYEQARGRLSNEGGYCCMGVLAHIVDDGDAKFESRCRTSRYGLPVSNYEYVSLLDLNDQQALNFPAIADWIEANMPVEES